MQNFIGKGYNQQFINNMSNVIAYLKNHEDDKIIKVIFAEDSLCQMCPNKGLGKCPLAVKHDRDYFNALHINCSEQYSWNDIKRLIEKYIDYQTFFSICSNCEWISVCSKIMKSK